MSFDFEAAKQEEGKGGLGEVGLLADKAIELRNEIERIELLLSDTQAAYRQVTERELPEAMDAVGCSLFKHDKSGLKIKVDNVVRAAIPVALKEQAFDWLIQNKFEDLIKNEIKMKLDRGEYARAQEILKVINDTFGITAETNVSVHASTLTAWAKEQLSQGTEIPSDLFGLFQARVAKVTK